MQLETGRPSAIEITDCDQPLPDKASGLNPHFIRWVTLSLLVGKISEHIFQRRAESALDFLTGIAQLDQALVDWLDEGAEDAKISQNAKTTDEKSFEVFISLHFHQVMKHTNYIDRTNAYCVHRHKSLFYAHHSSSLKRPFKIKSKSTKLSFTASRGYCKVRTPAWRLQGPSSPKWLSLPIHILIFYF